MQLTKSEVRLDQIAPEMLELAGEARVTIFAPPTFCARCTWTERSCNEKGIATAKIILDDRLHPILVALRVHLGLGPEAPITMPAVFVDGVYAWHDNQPNKVEEIAAQFQEEAEAAA